MSGHYKPEERSKTPEHFTGPAAVALVLGRALGLKNGQQIDSHTLLVETNLLWPNHEPEVLEEELERAVRSAESYRIFVLIQKPVTGFLLKRIA